jgi:hypothetical protein
MSQQLGFETLIKQNVAGKVFVVPVDDEHTIDAIIGRLRRRYRREELRSADDVANENHRDQQPAAEHQTSARRR